MNLTNISANLPITQTTNENTINSQNNVQIIKRRGRPRKYNNIEHNNDISFIEQDIIVCFPIIENNTNNINYESESIISTENETIDNFINTNSTDIPLKENKITNINTLQNIIEKQENIITQYKQQLKKYNLNENVNNENNNLQKIKITHCDCPIETKNNYIVVPKNTKLCCMYDTCKINGTPFFLPNSYNNNTFNICGWFCSLNCALAYNINLKDEHISKRYSLLHYLYNITSDIIITPSPNYLLLKKFGGIYTIDEYRNKLLKETNNYRIISAPMSYIPLILEETIET